MEEEKVLSQNDNVEEQHSSFSIHKLCYAIATLGSLGEWRVGRIIAFIFAIPFLFLFRSIYWLNQTVFMWTLLGVMVLSVLIIQVALQVDLENSKKFIVLDKVIGAMLALAGISLRWRIVIFALILFYIINTLKPFYYHKKISSYIERLPGVAGVLGVELLSGLSVNLFLRVIAWVMG